MALLDDSARYLAVNEAFARFLGYSSDEFLSKTIADVTPLEELAVIGKWKVDGLVKGRTSRFCIRKRYVRKDRTVVWTKLTLTMICGGDGRVLYGIEVLDDPPMTRDGSISPGSYIERIVPERPCAIQAASAISDSVFDESAPARQFSGRLPPLTPREKEILKLLAAGKTLKEIAAHGRVSVQSVWKHQQRILRKFAVENQVELVRVILQARSVHLARDANRRQQTGRGEGTP